MKKTMTLGEFFAVGTPGSVFLVSTGNGQEIKLGEWEEEDGSTTPCDPHHGVRDFLLAGWLSLPGESDGSTWEWGGGVGEATAEDDGIHRNRLKRVVPCDFQGNDIRAFRAYLAE